MIASLTFKLPDEYLSHAWAISAPVFAGDIIELMNALKTWEKHGHKFTTPEDVIKTVREMISEAHSIASGAL